MIGAPAPDHEIGAGAPVALACPACRPAWARLKDGDANEVPDARELPAQTPARPTVVRFPRCPSRPSAHSLEVVSAPKQPLRSAVRALRPRQWTKNVLVSWRRRRRACSSTLRPAALARRVRHLLRRRHRAPTY